MGWLDLIVGKKNARTIKAVQKVASNAAAKPKPEKKAAAPKVEWQTSEKGNDKTEIDGFRITVFKQDAGWNYCFSEILDSDESADDEMNTPQFGDGYTTKSKAKKAVLEYFD
jgi:hypothetical protein